MADPFVIQSEYDSQGDLSQDYAGWLAEHLQAVDDVIAWHLVTHQGWDVDDALLVKDALMAGAFDLSDLFTAANLNAKKVDELGGGFDPDTHFELDGSVPSISFTGEFGCLNDLLDPDTGNGPIDLSAFLDKADTTYWTNDTAKGENYHFRGMFTGFVDDQDGYEEGWNDQDEPELNYFTFNFGETLTIVDSEGETIPEGTDGDYLNQTTDEDFNGESHQEQAEGGQDVSLGDGSSNIQSETVTPTTHETLNGESGDNGGDGMDAYEITDPSPYDGIKIISGGDEGSHNMLIGGAGGNGQDGGDGGDVIVHADNNANGNILTAGDGGDGGDGGSGGHAIVNGDLNVVIIEGDRDLTILGGSAGAGGEGGEGGDVTVTANRNANDGVFTAGDGGDHGDGGAGGDGGGGGGDGGEGGDVTVVNASSNSTITDGNGGQEGAAYPATGPIVSAFSHSVNVDATAFEGYLTISLSDFVDSLEMGSGGGEIYATLGSDQYILGDGDETIIYTSVAQSDGSTYTDSIDGFDLSADFIDISAIADAGRTIDWDNTSKVLTIDLDGDDTTFDDVLVINLLGVNTDNAGIEDILIG